MTKCTELVDDVMCWAGSLADDATQHQDINSRLRLSAIADALRWLAAVIRADDPEAQSRFSLAYQEVSTAMRDASELLTDEARKLVTILLQKLDSTLSASRSMSSPTNRGGEKKNNKAEIRAVTLPLPVASPLPARAAIGASAPRTVVPGGWFVARFLVCRQGEEELLREKLTTLESTDDRITHLGLKTLALSEGTLLRLYTGPGLVAAPGEPLLRQLNWSGELLAEEFNVVADTHPTISTSLLRFEVEVGGVVVARLSLDLHFSTATDGQAIGESALATRAFASYSSHNRARVLDRVAALRIGAGMDVFIDCLDLAPSKAWQPRLAKEIATRDLFLLFWSEAASTSRWVRWEYTQALALLPSDCIQIQPLDNKTRAPRALKHLHFGDVLNDIHARAVVQEQSS